MDPSHESATDTVIRQLQQALDSRVVIEQAKGMIAVQRGLRLADAFEQLRSEARRRRQTIQAVAVEVVGTHDGEVNDGLR